MDLDFPFPVYVLGSTTAAQEQESIQYTDVVHNSALGFHTAQDLFTQVRKDIMYTNQSKELIYANVPIDWGSLVVESLSEDEEAESSGAAINFNSYTEILWIRMMSTRLEKCHVNWLFEEMYDWKEDNFMLRRELRLLSRFTNSLHVSVTPTKTRAKLRIFQSYRATNIIPRLL